MMTVFQLERQGNFRSMTVFHALAHLGIEGLVVVEPDHPFLCLGYFDDARQIIDFEFCAEKNLAVMRRELGGGLVLLGPGQIFYQLIIKRGDPRLPFSVAEAYQKFSQAPIATYRRLGVAVSYRAVNDLVTAEGRKISGQGAADINGCFVFVGNILCEFDVDVFSRSLKVSDERFRRRLLNAMEQNLSWLARELDDVPPAASIAKMVQEGFESILGPLAEQEIPKKVWTLADQLAEKFTSPEFVFTQSSRSHSTIKVREGIYLRYAVYNIFGGRVLVEVEIEKGRIKNALLTPIGVPPNTSLFRSLSKKLQGVEFGFHAVTEAVADVYNSHRIRYPGFFPEDLAFAIVGERS